MSALDRLEQQRSQLQRHIKDYSTMGKVIGTDRDNDAHRKKITRHRQRVEETFQKAQALLSDAPTGGPDAADWEAMKQSIRGLRGEYETIDRDTRGRENAHRLAGAAGPSDQAGTSSNAGTNGGAGAGGSRPQGGHTTVKMQDFKQIDDAELHTEEALQREKLAGILDVERDMNQLNSMYHELHGHIEGQQVGLTTAETNIDRAQTHVEKGITELKSANKLQKSSRKKMFILLGIIALIIVVVIVVVVVMKK
jgi:hypothetical protein